MADLESGSDLLRTLDQGIGRLREDVSAVDRTVQTSSAAVFRINDAELVAYRRLAELRLEQLTRGDVVKSLAAVSQRVREVLERRESALLEAGRRLEEIERQLEALEAQREAQRRHVEGAAAALDEREGDVQERLEEDADYGVQLERAQQADAVADRAESKTADAEGDRTAKGAPYEADPLFMYLWRRGYGTAAYSANPLARWLDGWVARLCNYERSRPNYWMLQEIPERLRAHAERVRAAASTEFEKLKARELAAADAGGVTEAKAALDERERKLDALDEEIAAAERDAAALREERTAFAAGEDEGMRSAREMVTAELQSAGIEALRRHAAATPTAEDDRLVAEILEHEQERERLEAALAEHRTLHERHVARLRELEAVRRQFKQHRYDDLHSVFTNRAFVALAVNEFLRGMIGGNDLWKALRRHQRFRQVHARPTFGTGGFPGRSGSWGIPRSGGWNLPRSGGFGGGGFRTGGGFGGGGGFKTGGGF